jgi:Skp family chaperone for outer membrane proteins
MMNTDGNIWNTLGAGGLGAMIGIIGTILTAVINRQAPMAALVDARIRMLIEGYESRINDLQEEIAKLETKIDALTSALNEAHTRRGLGL